MMESVADDIKRRRGRGVGELLANILSTQHNGEYYTEEHYRRLKRFEAASLQRPHRTERCMDVHGPNCQMGCRSCHSCRQKTVERKTECRCGRGTGYWCGSCLSTRMGQNIDEALRRPDWQCPSCLQICNCSGRTCDRHLAGLGCTKMLSGEARDQGYQSTAHYLIQTHLEMVLGIAPALDVGRFQLPGRARQDDDQMPNAKRPRLERLNPRSLKAIVEEEMGQSLLSTGPTSAEQEALQMTELWLSLPQSNANAFTPAAPGPIPRIADVSRQQGTAVHSFLRSDMADQHQRTAAVRPPNIPNPSRLGQPPGQVAAGGSNLASLFGLRSSGNDEIAQMRQDPVVSLAESNTDGPHVGLGDQDLREQYRSGHFRQAQTTVPGQFAGQGHRNLPSGEPMLGGTGQQGSVIMAPRQGTAQLQSHHAAAPLATTSTRQNGGQTSSCPEPGPAAAAATAQAGGDTRPLMPRNPLAGYVSRSEGTFGSLVQVALEYYNPAYQEGSEEQEAAREAVEMCLAEMQQHFMSSVSISGYNKDLVQQLKSETELPEHDMRDHDCLKDACHILLIAVDASESNAGKAVSLLCNEDPFVDFKGTDPRGRAIIVKTAFQLLQKTVSDRLAAEKLVHFVLGCLEVLTEEHEALSTMPFTDSVEVGPLKIGPAAILGQQHQLQEDVTAVQQADDLLLQLIVGQIQQACSAEQPGCELFLKKAVFDLMARETASDDVRFRVCCLLTMLLVSAGQGLQLDELSLWEKQHKLAQVLLQAEVLQTLLSLVQSKQHQPRGLPQTLGFANEAGDRQAPQSCPRVDAVKDKLLARVMGLFVAAGQKVWLDLVQQAMKPFANASHFCLQATGQQRQQASIFLTIGLQACPGAILYKDAEFLVRLWLWLCLDHSAGTWSILTFVTQAFSTVPALKLTFAQLSEPIAGGHRNQDARGHHRAIMVQQVLTAYKGAGNRLSEVLSDIVGHAERVLSLVHPSCQSICEAATCRILMTICSLLPLPEASDFVTRALTLISKCAKQAAAARIKSRAEAGMAPGFHLEASVGQPTDAVQERQALQDSCLGCLPLMAKLLAGLYRSVGNFAWERTSKGAVFIRDLLSSVLSSSSEAGQAADIPRLHFTQGSIKSQIMVETVANALADCGGPAFLHYVVGTFLPFALSRSEQYAVNAARLLTQLFKQPSIRQSQHHLQSLLPQLLLPLLEALFPTSQPGGSGRIPVGILNVFANLVHSFGESMVPPTTQVPMPARNLASDLNLFLRGEAPSLERFQAALQKVLHILCCCCINSLDFSLKGKLAPAREEQAAATTLQIRPVTNQDVVVVKDHLVMLLGISRPLEAVRLAYSDAPAPRLPPVPPDYFLRQAEQALTLVQALVQSGGKHGQQWALQVCQAIKPLLIPPKGTDDLRKIYMSCVDDLLAVDGSLGCRDLPLPREGIGTSFEEASTSLPQASSGRASRIDPPRRSPLAEISEAQSQSRSRNNNASGVPRSSSSGQALSDKVRSLKADTPVARLEGSFLDFKPFEDKHHLLMLKETSFRLTQDQPSTPFTSRVHVWILNRFVTQQMRQQLVTRKEDRLQQRSRERIVLTDVVFKKFHSKHRDIPILTFTPLPGMTSPARCRILSTIKEEEEAEVKTELPAIKLEEEEVVSQPATLPVALTQAVSAGANGIRTGGHGNKQASLHLDSHRAEASDTVWSAGQPAASHQPASYKGNVGQLLTELQNMKVTSDLGRIARALQAALEESLPTREALLERAVVILLENC